MKLFDYIKVLFGKDAQWDKLKGYDKIRIYSALYTGLNISTHYDGLIAKLIIHGKDRKECLVRLNRALQEFVIEGIDTTIPLHQRLLKNEEFLNGHYNINWLEKIL